MVSPAPWQYLMKIAVWGHIAADLLVSWTEHPETFSMVCNFITHLVETRTLEEGFSSSVPVSPPGNVWLRTWARELRFKSETSDLMLTFMCMWEQENGFHETEPVWILAHILVPSIMARDWSGALKKTKNQTKQRFLISVFLFLCSPVSISCQSSKWDCQVLQEHLFSSKTQSIRKILSSYLFIRRSSVQLGKVIWRGQAASEKLADPWGASVRSYSKISLGSWTLQLHMDSHPSIYSGVQTCSSFTCKFF